MTKDMEPNLGTAIFVVIQCFFCDEGFQRITVRLYSKALTLMARLGGSGVFNEIINIGDN